MKINPRPIIFILIVVTVFFIAGCADTGPFAINQLNADSNQANKRNLDERIDNRVENKINKGEQVDVIIEFTNRGTINGVINSLGTDFKEKARFKYSNAVAGRINKNALDKLKNNPDIKSIYLDEVFKISLQDSVPLINADNAWSINIAGKQITGSGAVCVLDTGIDYNHPDLDQNYLGGYDFVNNDTDPMDDHGHGTHVAGIVAANGVIKGVAPDAKLLALKVCDFRGDCQDSNVIRAIEWCVNNKDIYNINTVTMSFGEGLYTTGCDLNYPSTTSAIAAAINRNIAVFAATGNLGGFFPQAISSPACISNVIAVGATNKNDVIASYSNRGRLLDVMAPGSSITSTRLGGGTIILSGTSMATPHVAGASNLIRQYYDLNGLTVSPSEIEILMEDWGIQIYDPILGYFYPRIDIYNSIKQENPPIQPVIIHNVQGPIYPTFILTNAIEGRDGWLNIDNARLSDDNYATSLVETAGYKNGTYFLVAKGFNFNIPSNAFISGLQFDLEGKYSILQGRFGGQSLIYHFLSTDGTINLGSGPTSSSAITTSESIFGAGNQNDEWSTSPSIPNWLVNDPDFGLAYRFQPYRFSDNDPQLIINVSIDMMRATIYYDTVGSTTSSTTPSTSIFTSSTSTSTTSSISTTSSTSITSTSTSTSILTTTSTTTVASTSTSTTSTSTTTEQIMSTIWLGDTPLPTTTSIVYEPSPVIKPGTLFGNDATAGTILWDNPGNLIADDGLLTMATVSNGQRTQFVIAKGFNFNIPPGATINGIAIRSKGRMTILSGSSGQNYQIWKIIKNGVISTAGASESTGGFFTGSIGYISRGGATSLWGKTWAPADINSPEFGIAFQGATSLGDYTLEYALDFVEITVYYTPPPDPQLFSLVNAINSIFSIGTAGGDGDGVVVSGGSSGGSAIVPIQTYQNGTVIAQAADTKINPAVIIIAIIILVYLARKKGRR